MDTLAIVRLAIADGQLSQKDADLAQKILTTHGEEVFRYFLLYRNEAKRTQRPLTPQRRPLAR